MKKVYFKLKELLEHHQMSQTDLAKETELSFSTICEICNNKTSRISMKTLNILTDYFDCEVGDLFERN